MDVASRLPALARNRRLAGSLGQFAGLGRPGVDAGGKADACGAEHRLDVGDRDGCEVGKRGDAPRDQGCGDLRAA